MERNRIMKKINIKYYVKSLEQFDEGLQHILAIFYDKDIFHLEINLVMDTLNDTEIKKIINYISKNQTFKEISNNTIYTFIVTIFPSPKLSRIFSKIKGLLSRIDLVSTRENTDSVVEAFISIQKKRLPCSLLIREASFEDVISIYRRSANLGAPIFVEDELYFDNNFISLFKEWVYDKNGCRINLFADVLSRILLDYWGTKCQYKSCLTKNFLVDTDGSIYSCRKKENRICNLRDVSSINDILSHKNFISFLKCSITKRTQCKALCGFYELCQGGCPLNSDISIAKCKDRKRFLAVGSITELIISIIRDSNYKDLNPAVRDMILSSVASNKIFEKGIID